jgi:hypothetical protein
MSSLSWFTINNDGTILTVNSNFNVEGNVNVNGGYFNNSTALGGTGGGGSFWSGVFGGGIYYAGVGANVGIGLTNPNPAYRLDVAGDVNISGQYYRNGVLFTGGGGPTLWSEVGGKLSTDVNVGINTTNPQTSLHVNDSTTTSDVTKGIRVGVGSTFMTMNFISPVAGTPYFLMQTKQSAGPIITGNVALNPEGGFVGIGRTNPGFTLDVSGNVNFTGDLFKNGVLIPTGGGAGGWINDGPDVYYPSSGNVGIGGVPLAGTRLQVYGNLNLNGTTDQYRIGGSAVLTRTILGSTVVNSSLTSVGNLTSLIVDTNTLVVVPGLQRVGIGLTNPSYKLHVAGSINGSDILVNGTPIVSGNTLGASITQSSLTTVGTLVNLNVSGNVGIGTNNPGAKLNVYGDINDGLYSTITNLNAGTGAFGALRFVRDSGVNGLILFQNSSGRTVEGGGSVANIRNDGGSLRIQGFDPSVVGTWFTSTGNVGIGITNPLSRFVVTTNKTKLMVTDTIFNASYPPEPLTALNTTITTTVYGRGTYITSGVRTAGNPSDTDLGLVASWRAFGGGGYWQSLADYNVVTGVVETLLAGYDIDGYRGNGITLVTPYGIVASSFRLGPFNSGQSPRVWRLYGNNPGGQFTQLFDMTGETWATTTPRVYEIPVNVRARYSVYRIVINAIQPNQTDARASLRNVAFFSTTDESDRVLVQGELVGGAVRSTNQSADFTSGSPGAFIDMVDATRVVRMGSTTGGTTPSGTQGEVSFFVNNGERMRLNAAGNVGIGITNPSAILHIGGSLKPATLPTFWTTLTQSDSKILFYANSEVNWSGMGVDQGGRWWLRTGTSQQNFILLGPNGNLGIGTTTPTARLHVMGADRATLRIASVNGQPVSNDTWQQGSVFGQVQFGAVGNLGGFQQYPASIVALADSTITTAGGVNNGVSGRLEFRTLSSTNGLGDNQATPVTRMTISSAGDVSIGQFSSDYRFLRMGGGNSFGFLYGSFAALGDGIHLSYNHYYDASGAIQYTREGLGASNASISVNYGQFVVRTGINDTPPLPRLLVDSAGNVGIGTATPGYTLHVQGDINFTGNLLQNGVAFNPGGSSQWVTSGSNISYTTGNVGIGTAAPGASRLRVDGNPANTPDKTVVRIEGSNTSFSSIVEGQSLLLLVDQATSTGNKKGIAFARGETLVVAGIQPSILGGGGGNLDFYTSTTDNAVSMRMRIAGGGNVGIGTTNPTTTLHLASNGNILSLDQYTNSSVSGAVMFTNFGRGTLLTPAAVQNNDVIFGIYSKAHNGTALSTNNIGAIRVLASETHTTAAAGTKIDFATTPNGQLARIERMVIDHTGNVGIGTTNPAARLDVREGDIRVGANPGNEGDGWLPGTVRFGVEFFNQDLGTDNTAGVMGAIKPYVVDNTGYSGLGIWNNTAQNTPVDFSTQVPQMLFRGSNVGIGTMDPRLRLHVVNTDGVGGSGNGILVNSFANSTTASTQMSQDGDNLLGQNSGGFAYFYWRISGTKYVGTLAAAQAIFTGQHMSFSETIGRKDVGRLKGLIVVSTGKHKTLFNAYDNTNLALKRNDVNNSHPMVELSSRAYQKSVYGVVSNYSDQTPKRRADGTIEYDEEPQEDGLYNDLHERIRVNSIGEGSIWVTNENGPIENGDYIVSSSLPGYGMKQSDDVLRNYTVAKSTIDCDFQRRQVVRMKLKHTILKDETGAITRNIITNAAGIPQFEPCMVSDLRNLKDGEEDEYVVEDEYDVKYFYKGEEVSMYDYEALYSDEDNRNNLLIAAFIPCTYHCG